MKYIISTDSYAFKHDNHIAYDTTFSEFVTMISKPEYLPDVKPDNFKFDSKAISPITLVPRENLIYTDYGAIAKKQVNIATVNMLGIDFDDIIDDPTHIDFVHEKLMDLNHVLYQSVSWDTPVNGTNKRKYNFRCYLELGAPIPAHLYPYTASMMMIGIEAKIYGTDVHHNYKYIHEWMSWNPNKSPDDYIAPRKLIDICTNQTQRHMVYPYVKKGTDLKILSQTNAKAITVSKFTEKARKLKDKDKKVEEKREQRKNQLKNRNIMTGGNLNPAKNILGQIAWDQFNLGDFIAMAGLDLKEVGNGKYQGMCPLDHNSPHNDTEMVIMENAGEMPSVHCSHGCRYHGKGATKNLFNDYSNDIPSDWIIVNPEIIISDIPSIPLTNDDVNDDDKILESIREEIGEIEDSFKYDNKATLILAIPGAGKSITIANKVSNNLDTYNIILCTGLNEMHQMRETLISKGVPEHLIHNLHSDNRDIIDTATIIISHYTYTKRKGNSDELYPLTKWIEDKEYTVYADEIDAYIDDAFTQIDLSKRYLYNSSTKGYRATSVCPSKSSNYYRCDDCRLECRTWQKIKYGNPIFDFATVADNHEFANPSRVNLNTLTSVNSVKETITVKTTAVHNLEYDYLEYNAGSLDNPIAPIDHHRYIDDIISTSLYAFKTRTNYDMKRDNEDLYNELCNEYRSKNKQFSESSMLEWVRKEMNKNVKFPYHPCGTETLCFLDTKGFKKIVNNAKKVYMLTGTISPYQKKTLLALNPDMVVHKVEPKNGVKFKPMEKCLVITCTDQFKIASLNDKHKHYITIGSDVPVKYDNGIKINKQLLITETKSEITALTQINEASKFFRIYDADSKGWTLISEGMFGEDPDTMAVHKRSSITRGINLGQYSTVYYDYQASKSMNAYDFGQVANLEECRRIEHTQRAIQSVGRIFRKPKINGTLSDEAPYKVVVIHGTTESVNGDVFDVHRYVYETLEKEYKYSCDKFEHVHIDKYTDVNDMVRIIKETASHYVKHGEINVPMPTIPESAFDKAWSKFNDTHIVRRFFTEESFNHIKNVRKYSEKLIEYKNQSTHLTKVRRRENAHWARIKNKIPAELLPEYLEFFDGN